MRLPSRPSFASGCLSSSRIWNSIPIADPTVAVPPAPEMGARPGCTNSLMPLLAPGVSLNSTVSSKFAKRFSVMMSPPPLDSWPPFSWVFRTPFSIDQPCVGKPSDLALRQPSVVFPSQSRRQPAAFSAAVSAFGAAASGAGAPWARPRTRGETRRNAPRVRR